MNFALESLKQIWQDHLLSWSIKFSVVIIVVQLATILLFYKNIPPQIPLFYSRPWGAEQLANKFNLFILPGTLFGLLITNLILTVLFLTKEKLLVKIFMATNILVSLLLGITFFKIFLLVVF